MHYRKNLKFIRKSINNMKKIGIITLFYKNYNYGGLLQAYALPQIIRKLGFEAEQIQMDITLKPVKIKRSLTKTAARLSRLRSLHF